MLHLYHCEMSFEKTISSFIPPNVITDAGSVSSGSNSMLLGSPMPDGSEHDSDNSNYKESHCDRAILNNEEGCSSHSLKFISASMKEAHHKSIRNVAKPSYPCKVCSEVLASVGSLRHHLKKCHRLLMQFFCEICLIEFTSQKDMLLHRNAHLSADGRFCCELCGKKLVNYHRFISHCRSHGQATGLVDGWDKCNECGESFSSEQDLCVHKNVEHSSLVKFVRDSSKLVKNFVCQTCGKKFAFSCLLQDHTNLHSGLKPYFCTKCDRRFFQKSSLKQHVRTHREEHPYKCSECSKGFHSRGDLRKHERRHTGERPYVCEMCGEGFSQSSHLGAHRRAHTGERPHACIECGRSFAKRADLARHSRLHSGELPYLCQLCGRKFRQSGQCAAHIRSRHRDTSSPLTVASLSPQLCHQSPHGQRLMSPTPQILTSHSSHPLVSPCFQDPSSSSSQNLSASPS